MTTTPTDQETSLDPLVDRLAVRLGARINRRIGNLTQYRFTNHAEGSAAADLMYDIVHGMRGRHVGAVGGLGPTTLILLVDSSNHVDSIVYGSNAGASVAHVCDDNAVPYVSDGALGHGFECGICGAFLQAG
jgi:hypothetical protein